MTRSQIDRTAIFLGLIFVLFLWDLAYFLGIRNPKIFPHPFVLFRTLGDVEFLRGFGIMLRLVIYFFASGGLIGIAIGSLCVRSSWLTHAVLHLLHLGLWLPFMVIFAVPDVFLLGTTAVILSSCYHYVAAWSILGLQGREAWTYVLREAMLQALFFSLISQIWFQYWDWFSFPYKGGAAAGFGVLTVLVVFMFLVNWIFRSNFELTAGRCGTILVKVRNSASWKSSCGFLLFAVTFLIIWQLVISLRYPQFHSSPLEVAEVGYHLLSHSEIYGDMWLSLLELLGGAVLGGSMGLIAFTILSRITGNLQRVLFFAFPLTYISPIVLWIFSWLFIAQWFQPAHNFLHFWHKVIAVGFLTFFTFTQTLWGLRDRPQAYRVLLAIDEALPIAFVAMLFGELFGATAGIGFMMTVASATYQIAKGLVGFLITVLLLVTLSSTLRWILRRDCLETTI